MSTLCKSQKKAAIAAILVAVIAFTTVACDDFFGEGGGGSWPGSTVDNPILKKPAVTINAANWDALLAEIEAAGKYVTLDLSACPMTGTLFDPDNTNPAGKRYIVNLTLPDAAEITFGSFPDGTFKNFDNLTSVTGNGITDISYYTFKGCTSLSVVNFPNVVTIDRSAFAGCTSLSVMNIPNAENIGSYAIAGCTSLTGVNFPNAEYIGANAFTGCTSLSVVNIPNAEYIDPDAIAGCTSLEQITIGANCMISPTDPISRGFETAYNAAGQAAGTYRYNGTNWIKQ